MSTSSFHTRLLLAFAHKIPHGIDDRSRREMNHAFLRADPAQLAIGCERAPEAAHVGGDVFELLADDERRQRLDRRDDDFVAAPDREREAMTREPPGASVSSIT